MANSHNFSKTAVLREIFSIFFKKWRLRFGRVAVMAVAIARHWSVSWTSGLDEKLMHGVVLVPIGLSWPCDTFWKRTRRGAKSNI